MKLYRSFKLIFITCIRSCWALIVKLLSFWFTINTYNLTVSSLLKHGISLQKGTWKFRQTYIWNKKLDDDLLRNMNKHLYSMWKEYVLVQTNEDLFRKTSSASTYIQNYEVLFLFSSASSTWQCNIGGIERRGSEAL